MKVYICFPGGKAKAFTMSYDDGVYDDIRLLELMNKNGLKGTFNINYGYTSGDAGEAARPRIPLAQIKEVYKGHEIATHSWSHPTIARCPAPMIASEILEDRKGLEAVTGAPVRGHAYPNGSYSDEVKNIFSSLGIAYGRVVETDPSFELPTDPMEWKGTCRHADPKLMDYAKEFVEFKKKQYLRLMYVWGHSYEFSEHDNWNVAEEFCAYMGGHEDIWYATNIEIIDYMDAAKRLQFSADGSFVYNPSAISVWVAVDDNNYVELLPGKTTHLAD